MSEKHWGTEQDVLKDLEELYGMNVTNINGDVFIHGQGPPPRMVTDEDALPRSCDDRINLDIAPPDLMGIRQMLSIVKAHENQVDDVSLRINSQAIQKECILTISKMNPNVPDFVPKSGMTDCINQDTELKNEISHKSEDLYKQSENVKQSEDDVDLKSHTGNDMDLKKVNNEEHDIFAERLKKTISCKDKSDTCQLKKDRNLAMSTLLKLYSSPASSQIENIESPKLITPNYFASCKAGTSKSLNGEVEVNRECLTNGQSVRCTTASSEISSSDVSNSEIEQSIKKVNNWLNPTNNPTKPKAPPVHLGKVAFKRKEPSSCKSTTSTSNKPVPKSSTVEYKPTKYAEELIMKFKEREKQCKEPILEFGIPVSKLELELKARDEVIRRRIMEERASKINKQLTDN